MTSTKSISSISKGSRQSNFELLRLVAMFMILGLHANYSSFGFPSRESFAESPIIESARILLETACICSVNVFVMISGWFGIRPSIKGFCSFIFQVLYFYFLAFFISFAFGLISFSPTAILHIFILRNSGWFVVSYAILYVLSPVLNTFLENVDKRQQTIVLLSFFAAELYWGFIDKRPDFCEGYSAMSFIGLYLLSGYLRRYGSVLYEWGG